MMENKGIEPNENVQLLEMLTFKNLCLTKSVAMYPLVSDEELKAILKNDVSLGQQHVKELQSLLQKSGLNK